MKRPKKGAITCFSTRNNGWDKCICCHTRGPWVEENSASEEALLPTTSLVSISCCTELNKTRIILMQWWKGAAYEKLLQLHQTTDLWCLHVVIVVILMLEENVQLMEYHAQVVVITLLLCAKAAGIEAACPTRAAKASQDSNTTNKLAAASDRGRFVQRAAPVYTTNSQAVSLFMQLTKILMWTLCLLDLCICIMLTSGKRLWLLVLLSVPSSWILVQMPTYSMNVWYPRLVNFGGAKIMPVGSVELETSKGNPAASTGNPAAFCYQRQRRQGVGVVYIL